MSLARNPLSDWFDYVFNYLPTTNWQHAFSPTINFGCNTQDAPIEQHVVDSVGSYGFQLNRVLDALTVLMSHVKLNSLTPDEQQKIDDFKDLATAADDAANDFHGEATQANVRQLIEGMDKLRKSDPELYHQLAAQLRDGIPEQVHAKRLKLPPAKRAKRG